MDNFVAYTELTAFVMNQLPTGTAFAVSEQNSSEQIFIPSQVARVQNLVPGDRITVRAIPNKKEGGAKWFAVFASPIAPADVKIAPVAHTQVVATPAPSVDWYASAKAALNKLGGVATTVEVADECGCATHHISTYLRTMHDRGEICRAGIRSSSKQSKDSLVYWGLTLDDLIPAGMVGDDA